MQSDIRYAWSIFIVGPSVRMATGDVVYLNALGRSIVVLNSQKAAADLLGRRGRVYSDRPRFIMASEILTGGLEVTFLPYGTL